MQIEEVYQKAQRICDNMEQVIVGKRPLMEYVLAAFLAQGHVLLEDVPGTGKTMLAKSLAASFGMSFKRIQFTPDLLPSDVTGIYYFDQKTSEFEFRPGGIFSNILLADEINRATPRTQSSLLECMQEGQATIDGETMRVGDPFFVIATQNPVETGGTFPLPEAQLDRFMVKLTVGYPDETSEEELFHRVLKQENTLERLQTVCTIEEFVEMKEACTQVTVHDIIVHYVLSLARKSRGQKQLAVGVSSRGAIALLMMARCYAAVSGKEFVTPDMIKTLAPLVWGHRIVLADSFGRKTPENCIMDLLNEVAAPTEEAFLI